MPYWNPLRLPNGRRPNPQMPDNGDFTIPLVLWHSILMLVAESDVQDALNCRLVCKTFRNLIDDYRTYSVIDLGMNLFLPYEVFRPPAHVETRTLFLQRCVDAGNPMAVFRHAFIILQDSGNLPLSMNYLRTICGGNGRVHRLALYVLTMFDIMLGPEPVRSSSIRSMINNRDADHNMYWGSREVREILSELGPLHRDLRSHIPMSGWPFLPQHRCGECGQYRYVRQDFSNSEWLNGDYTLGRCCLSCLCYVEAASFLEKLRVGIAIGLWNTFYEHLPYHLGIP